MGAGHIPCRAWRDDEQESRSRSFDDCRADVYRVRGDKAVVGSVGGHGRISCAGRDSPYNVRRRATGELAIPAGVCGGGDIRLRDGHVDAGFQKRCAHGSVLKMDYAYRGRRDDGGGRGVLFRTYMPLQVHELFVAELSDRYSLKINRVKLVFDLSFLVLSVVLALTIFRDASTFDWKISPRLVIIVWGLGRLSRR